MTPLLLTTHPCSRGPLTYCGGVDINRFADSEGKREGFFSVAVDDTTIFDDNAQLSDLWIFDR